MKNILQYPKAVGGGDGGGGGLVAKQCVTLVTLWLVAHQAPLSTAVSQTKLLEWVAISLSSRSSHPRD